MRWKKAFVVVIVVGVLFGVLPPQVLLSLGITPVTAAEASQSCSLPYCRPLVEGIKPPPSFFKERHCKGCHRDVYIV